MRTSITSVLAVFTAFIGLQAQAEESLLEHVLDSCKSDLEIYCNQVTPGQGRILHCIAAHEDKISGQCGYALYQSASLLEQLATAIAYVGSECMADIERHCGAVAAGEGRILMCLEENADDVSEGCKKAVSDVVAE
jgi:hypothetical protein